MTNLNQLKQKAEFADFVEYVIMQSIVDRVMPVVLREKKAFNKVQKVLSEIKIEVLISFPDMGEEKASKLVLKLYRQMIQKVLKKLDERNEELKREEQK